MMDELIVGVLDELCYDVRLKVEQQEAFLKLVEGKHVIALIPTSFGKIMIYTVFPIIKRKLTGKRQTVLVTPPLWALMLDQQTILKTLISTYIWRSAQDSEEVLAWLPQHVMSRKEKSRKIVVCCQSLRDCQNIFMWLMEDLADKAYKDKQPVSNNRLVEMFHSRMDKVSVARILEDFVKLHPSSYI